MPENPFAAQLGRISGKLLAENLLRDGVDLTFRNEANDSDLLYLQVTDKQIGINTDTPVYDLDVNSNIFSNNLISSRAIIDNIIFESTAKITTVVGEINIRTTGSNPTAIFDKLQAGNIQFDDNIIKNFVENQNLTLIPNGSGTVELQENTLVDGNLFVSGSIKLDGDLSTTSNITIGDHPLDVVIIEPSLKQDINPGESLTYDLGNSSRRWKSAYIPDWTTITNIVPKRSIINQNLILGQNLNNITTVNPANDVLINPGSGITIIESIKIEGEFITNLMQPPDIDPIKIASGLTANINGEPEGDVWNTLVTGRELFLGGGQTVETFRTAKLGDIRNDLSQLDIINNDDIDIILSIGSQQGSTLNEELWYHTTIKPTILNDTNLYSQYGITDSSLDNTTLTLSSTGIGYVKFATTSAMVIPIGPSSERRYSEIGETRWNTDLDVLECFDGNVYFIATGPGLVVNGDLMTDLAITRALVLG
jgi:hypothetical protein